MSDFAISNVLPGKLNALVKNLMNQMGITDPNEAVRRVNAGEWVVQMVRRLACKGEISLSERIDAFDPTVFYQNRKGLHVWDGSRSFILAVAQPVEFLPAMQVVSFDLTIPMNDAEIKAELPTDHVFEDASVFSAHLAGMIERQPGGTGGTLLSNGFANVFYVRGINAEVFTVCVRWSSAYHKWGVDAYRESGFRWIAGNRVFSSNCLPAEA